MKQPNDIFTQEIDGLPKRRGRPATRSSMTAAERKAAQRARLAEEGRVVWTGELSVDVVEALRKSVQFKDETQAQAVDRILKAYLLRKR